jgi:ubiquinol-cytochrome c reductase cytochrome c subunit
MKQIATVIFILLAASAAQAAAPSAARGKQVYMANGCWTCHGTVGQGSFTGLKLVPEPLPLDAMITFIRGSTGPMPAYSADGMPDADIADIHAYLSSVPKSPTADSIPILRDLKPGK